MDPPQHTGSYNGSTEGDIDLVVLFKEAWKRRRTVLFSLLATSVLGFIIALLSPEEYTAKIRLMPQATNTGNNASSILQRLGGLSGISFGSASGTINPMLYPDITSSSPFYLFLLDKSLHFPTQDTTMTLQHYFSVLDQPTFLDILKKYTIGLPKILIRLPIQLFQPDKPTQLPPDTEATVTPNDTDLTELSTDSNLHPYLPVTISPQELAVIAKIRPRVETEIEPNGTLSVSATMPDPLVAANTTELAVDYLTNYITDYRVEKAQQDLDFINQQYEEKKERYIRAQQQVATMKDRNANLVTERGRTELERAQTEYDLSFGLYQSIAQQLEQAKVRVQEETPVFKILEPIQVPLGPSEPNRELIVILSAVAGVVIGIAIVIVQIIYSRIKPYF
ncbi:MAG: Wzz/FepE/Etk N-terminal domain-containing protein [Bacteroidota bacterium]